MKVNTPSLKYIIKLKYQESLSNMGGYFLCLYTFNCFHKKNNGNYAVSRSSPQKEIG